MTEPPALVPRPAPSPPEPDPGRTPGRPGETKAKPPGTQFNYVDIRRLIPDLPGRRGPAPNIVFAADPYRGHSTLTVLEGRPGDFAEIEHEGLIVVFAEASNLEGGLLDSVGALAEELEIETLPIYVSRFG